MKDVLLISRAIAPPWDEVSRNLVASLAGTIKNHRLHILTTPEGSGLSGDHLVEHAVYAKRRLTGIEKAKLVRFLMTEGRRFNLWHFCFTPGRATSALLRRIVPRGVRTIQTVPYIPRDEAGRARDLLFADAVTVPSNQTRSLLESQGIRRVVRVYPSVDLGRWTMPLNGRLALLSEMRRKLGAEGASAALYAGDISSDAMVEALARVVTESLLRNDRLIFWIATRSRRDGDKRPADASHQEKLKRKLEEAGLGARVRFDFPGCAMPELIQACDLLFHPFFEGFVQKTDIPLVIVEAMAAGKPVVVSARGPLEELVNLGAQPGVAAEDPEAFAWEIASLAEDEARRQREGERNRQVASLHFNREKNLKSYQALYDQL